MSVDLDDVPEDLRPAVSAGLAAAGVADGHLSLELVDSHRIAELNREHRDRDEPTDVLSFPVDGPGPSAGPRELGDVVICPEHTADLTEAAVHGVLHLCGYDHETDDGEMLALQARVVEGLASGPKVRMARPEEAADVVASYEWLFALPGSVPPAWDPEIAEERLLGAIASEDSAVIVAEADGRIAGLCTAYIDLLSVRFGLRCWVEDLAVDPGLRSQGVGRALLDAAKDWARGRGASHLELDSGEARADAHRFYVREGAVWPSKSFTFLLDE